MNKISRKDSGQIALIMVLIMTIVSAVAVSVAGRSTVETRVQQMDVESTQAFLAAQAGLEQAIAQNAAVPTGAVASGQEYQVTKSIEGVSYIHSEKLNPGEVLEVDLTGASGVTAVNIYWKRAGIGYPAIFVSDVRTGAIVDYAYDTAGVNGFLANSNGKVMDGVNYEYAIPSPISISVATSKMLRITMLSFAGFVGVEPIGGTLPPQSNKYRAVGNVTSSNNNVKYGIEYSESTTNQLPPIFDYVLFSGGSIIQ